MTARRDLNQVDRFQTWRSGIAWIVRVVGIGHIQTRHDPAFEPFHRLSLRVGLVIVAVKVEKPMHRQVSEVMEKNWARFGGF
jgi:hypothetical protein